MHPSLFPLQGPKPNGVQFLSSSSLPVRQVSGPMSQDVSSLQIAQHGWSPYLRMQLSHGFIAAALLISNASQLKVHLKAHHGGSFNHVLWMLVGSICGQLMAASCLLLAYWVKSKQSTFRVARRGTPTGCLTFADGLENAYMMFSFFIMAVNVFVAIFIEISVDDRFKTEGIPLTTESSQFIRNCNQSLGPFAPLHHLSSNILQNFFVNKLM